MKSATPLKIAIMGTRGIPACYGGFETFAQELSTRLVKRGHSVTVYGRRKFGATHGGFGEFQGVKTIASPTIYHKYLETPLASLTGFITVFKLKYDVILLCNAANAPFSWIARIARVPIVINVDGIERRRKKWNILGRWWYLLGELTSVAFASRIVSDAEVIQEYYRTRYRTDSTVIAYGAQAERVVPSRTLRQFGLSPRSYLLYVSRLEPENNAYGVVAAYNQLSEALRKRFPLVIVGDAPYAANYIKSVKENAAPEVIFTGYQFGSAYHELQSSCYLYIQATEVGGTHPALLEAMAFGNCIIANDTPEHREVLSNCGRYYSFNDFDNLRDILVELIEEPTKVNSLGHLADERAKSIYSWDRIVDQYEQLFSVLV